MYSYGKENYFSVRPARMSRRFKRGGEENLRIGCEK
jgi:hypothetical protein